MLSKRTKDPSQVAVSPTLDKDRRFGGQNLKAREYPRTSSRSWHLDQFSDFFQEEFPNEMAWDAFVSTAQAFDLHEAECMRMLHGDVIYLHDYRGCGAYVAYERDNGSIVLIKTLGEMGYMIPPHFADAPEDYFGEGISDVQMIHCDYLFPGTEMTKIVKEEIDLACEKKEYPSEGSFHPVDASFPTGYIGEYFMVIFCLSFDYTFEDCFR
eukprot:TRINITY_DN2647_c0_g1_i5.p1 TRINITY_DN2647_c0_g1~~TRINITY_DN2647_c0_g1_i5.p1  ORF type:complete len:211 (-),score=19.36 TRINITY_DN2647_c0_g1_i5:454-1086(-)